MVEGEDARQIGEIAQDIASLIRRHAGM